ncbi:MlaD family protein [Conexibacter sp. SYSU D00693]|uniref:MlaD family protein n=1 Tax=Conexibacter sp. SYSU D00693 TaxID=2812560 RepID=UPI00196B6D93|nr:MlaD family protein [Conexibacter sp. SYSU D00693]
MEREVLLVRGLAVAALVVVLAVVLTTVSGGGTYEVSARFRDAGQLVEGGRVQVAGRPVGTIKAITLADDGVADVRLELDDDAAPLHEGTRASIRAVGLGGIANRYVDLAPGPASAPEIDDGGVLDLDRTRGIVDLDAVLSSIDPRTRDRLRSVLRSGGRLFDDGAAQDANRALGYLEPAVAQVQALADELARDGEAFAAMVGAGSQAARALAADPQALRASLRGTARTLTALAAERRATGELLQAAPAAARQVRRTLRRTGQTLRRARPALRDLRAAAPGLAAVLGALPGAATAAEPVLAQLRATLPRVDATLRRAPGLERAGVPALRSTTEAIGRSIPIFAGLRPYSMDLVAGLLKGLGGGTGAGYDANGHAVKVELAAGGAVGSGLLSLFPGLDPPGLVPQRGMDKRCPGAGAAPAADGSNPWELPDLCEPGDRRP